MGEGEGGKGGNRTAYCDCFSSWSYCSLSLSLSHGHEIEGWISGHHLTIHPVFLASSLESGCQVTALSM